MRFLKWRYSRRAGYTLLAILGVLVVLRLALPYAVLWYVNRTLDHLPGYHGHVADIDLSLWRGAYEIEGMTLYQDSSGQSKPLFAARKIDLSVFWHALFDGQVVSKIRLYEPQVNFIAAPPGGHAQTGEDVPVSQLIQQLVPFNIDRFTIYDGEVHYDDFHSDPEVHVGAQDIHVLATNLTNTKDISGSLVANVKAHAIVLHEARTDMRLRINPYAKQPRFKLHFRMQQLELARLRDLFKAYSPITIQSGKMDLVTVLDAKDGHVEGYVKPLLRNLDIFTLKDNDHPLHLIEQAAAAGTVQILKNHSANQFATRIPISGDLDDPDLGILPLLVNILKNGFIRAFQPTYDQAVEDHHEDNDHSKHKSLLDKLWPF